MDITFADTVPLSFGGGYEHYLMRLARFASEQGHRCRIVTPRDRLARLINRPFGVRIFRRLDQDAIGRALGNTELVEVGPRDLRPALSSTDVMYLKNEPMDLAAFLRSGGHAVRSVVGFHSAMEGRPGLSGKMRARIYRSGAYGRLLQRARAYHVLTSRQLQALNDVFSIPSSRITLAPNGVDLEHYRPREPGGRGDVFRVLFVGRFDVQKGLDTLLRATPMLPSGTCVTIVGDGPLRRLVEQRADALPNVTHIPYQADLRRIYRDHDLLVAPSRWEVSPLVPAESLASGVPVIVTEITPFEPYRDCASTWRIGCDDADQLAGRITDARMVWSDPNEWAKLRTGARTFAEERLDERVAFAAVLDLLQRVAGTQA